MSEVKSPTVQELKSTYEKLVFVHQSLTQKNQYYIEEFELAKAAIQMITEMANKLGKELHDIEQAEIKAKAEAEAVAKQLADAKAAEEELKNRPKRQRKSKKNLEVVGE